MAVINKALRREEGLVWGDGAKDSSLYFDRHGVLVDALGRGAGEPAFRVRGLATNNAPTELFRVNKDGTVSLVGAVTVTAGGLVVVGGLSVDGVDVPAVAQAAGSNLATNPGLDVWQRGAGAFTASAAYAADRWQLSVGVSSTLSVTRDTANVDAGSQYCAACAYTHVAVSRVLQAIEDYFQLRGTTVTFTMRVKTSTANAVRISVWDSVNAFRYSSYHTGSGAYETLTVSAPIAAAATGVQVSAEFGASCTAYLDNAVLAVGTAAPAYRPLHPQDDLSRCQRYYYEIGGLDANEYAVAGQCTTTTSATGVLRYPVEMAVAPTITVSAGADWSVSAANGAVVACTALAASITTRRETRLVATVASGLVAGDATLLRANNTTAARIALEANP